MNFLEGVMNLSLLGAVGFNWTLFITIITYVLFFFVVIGATLKGMKRGAVRSAIRLGILVTLIIVAGLISMPIAKAIAGIDLSSLGVAYGDGVAQNLTEVVKGLLFEVEDIKLAAYASPALMALIEGLPLMVLSLVVFGLLTWIFRLIGYVIYVIIEKCALRSSKLERAAKKQAKAEKKARKKGTVITSQNQGVLQVPKRNRWLGALVGLVQGIVLAFVLFFPISSICGIVGDVAVATGHVSNGVVAESTEETPENNPESSTENVFDMIMPYFDSYNNTFVAKFVAMGGLDDVVFDELTKVEVDGTTIKIRHDLMEMLTAYNDVVNIFNFDQETTEWKDFNLEKMHEVVDKVLDVKLISSLMPDLVPHILETYIYDAEFFTELPASDITKAELSALMEEYKATGFTDCLKTDVDSLFKVLDTVFASGLVDDINNEDLPDEKLIEYLQANDNEMLNEIVGAVYDSGLMKVGGTFALNYVVKVLNEELEFETPVKYFDGAIFADEERKGIESVLDAVLDSYEVVKELGGVEVEDMTNEQIAGVANLLTALQNNTFKTYNENDELVERENTVVLSNQSVENGGPFSNMYIVIVDHFVSDYIENIDYKGADWKDVLTSVKAISSVPAGETPELEDVMNILGLDENIGENAKEIASSLKEISAGETLTKEETADLLNNISNSVENISEEQFNNIVDKVAETIGDSDLVNDVSYDILTTEKETAQTLAELLNSENGLNDDNVDTSLDVLAESEFILDKVAESGITVDNNATNLEEKIDAMSASEEVKNNLKTIFGIAVG